MALLAWYHPALTTCLSSLTLTFSAMFNVMFHILRFFFFFFLLCYLFIFVGGEGEGGFSSICFFLFLFFLSFGGRYTHTQWTDDL